MCLNPCLLKTLQSALDRGLLMRVSKLSHMAVLIMQRPANAMVSNAHESTGLLNIRFHTGLCCRFLLELEPGGLTPFTQEFAKIGTEFC